MWNCQAEICSETLTARHIQLSRLCEWWS